MLFKTDTSSLEVACLEYPAAVYGWSRESSPGLKEAADLVIDQLDAKDFTSLDRAELFRLFRDNWQADLGSIDDKKIDWATDKSRQAASLYATLMEALPLSDKAATHVERLQAGRRRDEAGRLIAAKLDEGRSDGQGLTQERAEEIYDTLAHVLAGTEESAMTTPKEILRRKESRRVVRVLTGLGGFDELTGGFSEGSLVIPYGLSGTGKSALMLSMMDQMHGNGIVCAYFSLEMPGEDVVARLLARRTEIPAGVIRDCYAVHPDSPLPPGRAPLTERQREHLDATRDWFEDTDVFIYGDGDLGAGFTLGMIGRAARRGVKVVFLDYAQLVLEEETAAAATALSHGLKREAARNGVVVIAACQLTKEGARKGSARRDGDELSFGEMPPPAPLWGLKASGSWEQDAVMCIATVIPPMITDAGRPIPMNEPVGAEIHVMKHRNGPKGCVDMTWNGPLMSWHDGRPENKGWDT
jgi:replicative DNA helicase